MAALAALALIAASTLPPDRLAIARQVAAPGLPGCRTHHPDGSEGPCLPSFVLRPGGAVGGRMAGGEIAFTHGAITRLDPHEFALLAGHEIAHWHLGHTRSSPAAELAADRLGAQLACRAGFDPARGAGLFRFLRPGRNHPAPALRRAQVLQVPCQLPGQPPGLTPGGRGT